MTNAISGLTVTPLRIIADERGSVMHMLRCDEQHFRSFGEIYFSTVNNGVIKAWKRHRVMTLNLAVPVGSIKIIIYDDRLGSPTRGGLEELIVGALDNYCLVTIEPMLWFGFQSLALDPSVVANCATIPHRPEEAEGRDFTDPSIPYRWTMPEAAQ